MNKLVITENFVLNEMHVQSIFTIQQQKQISKNMVFIGFAESSQGRT